MIMGVLPVERGGGHDLEALGCGCGGGLSVRRVAYQRGGGGVSVCPGIVGCHAKPSKARPR